MGSKLLVAAIDFGTTFSGWAFALENEYSIDPTKISCKRWNDGSNISMKAPTAVLIRPDGRTLEAFGYEAEEKYIAILENESETDYYFFRHFKMFLYGERTFSRRMKLLDEQGKNLNAHTVFALTIRYLKNDLLTEANSRIANKFTEEEVQWVLTVPAIWNDAAKQFMRMCAVEAGIMSENLLIALEPEAASLVCRHAVLNKDLTSSEIRLTSFPPGTRFLVLDAGGGTIDTVVHEILQDNRSKELFKASGGGWGGNVINDAFNDLIASHIGKDAFLKFKETHKEDYLDLQRAFEVKKRTVKPDQTESVKLKVPITLIDVRRSKSWFVFGRWKHPHASEIVRHLEIKGDKAVFDIEMIKSLFVPIVENIVKHLDTVLSRKETQGTSVIFMVGGFSESPILLEAVRRKFSPAVKVITQHDAGLAVLKGAVMFGFDQSVVRSRVSRFTYGLNWFEKNGHFDRELNVSNQEPFDKLIEVGESVELDKRTCSFEYTGCQSVSLRLFASDKKDPVYVDEDGCFMVGKFYTNCFGDVTVCLEFGDTEIRAIVEHEDGRRETAYFDFPI